MALEHGMIEPFVDRQTREGVISYGLSSYGYDARVAPEFRIFTNVDNAIVDPKNFSAQSFVERDGDTCVIPPNSFALARTIEYFRIPRDVLVICLGKSTYARCGMIVNVTPLEPEWEGHVTLEISNTTPLPARVYANEGICQFLFLKGEAPPEVSYADRKGKYMRQTRRDPAPALTDQEPGGPWTHGSTPHRGRRAARGHRRPSAAPRTRPCRSWPPAS